MLHLHFTWNPARILFLRTAQVLTISVASLMASTALAASTPADEVPRASQASAERRLRPQIESPLRATLSSVGSSSFREQPERSIGHQELELAGALPLLSTPGFSLGLAAAYSLRWVRVEGPTPWAVDDSMRLHRIEVTPVASVALSKHHRLLVRSGLVVASDFEKLGREALQPSLQLLDRITLSDSVGLLAGAGLSRQFFSLTPYPMLGVVYAPSGSIWRAAELTMPRLTELSKPSGLPNARTSCPGSRSSESARGSAGGLSPATRSTAMSVSSSTPTKVASRHGDSGVSTL